MSKRTVAGVHPVVVLVVLLLSVGTVWEVSDLRSDYNSAAHRVSNLESAQITSDQKRQDSDRAAAILAQQVKDLGAKPVVEPGEPSPGPAGAPGANGRPPTAQEIALAVRSYCSGGRCDGKNPTATQVANAVTSYCAVATRCRGDKGDAGANGADGQNGANGADGAKGDQGPAPTPEQIASAVSDYCTSNNKCAGPQGDTGVTDVKTDGCDLLATKTGLTASYDPVSRVITITCF